MIGFFDIIQAYFTKLTGRFVMFSGRDMVLLETWRAKGATAVSICRGIRDAVMHMDKNQPPRDLYNCRDYIEPYVEKARSRGGVSEFSSEATFGVASLSDEPLSDPTPKPRIPRRKKTVAQLALTRIEKAGQSCPRAEVRDLYREAWYQIRDVAINKGMDEQYGVLLELEEKLAEAYFDALPQHFRDKIELQLQQEVQRMGLSMSEEGWACHRKARRRYLMIKEHNLVSLLD